AGCQALQRRLRNLQAENDRLRRQLEEATRAGMRQAAPSPRARSQPKKLPEVPAVPGAGRGRLLRAPATETAATADRGIPARRHAAQLRPDHEATRKPVFIA